LSIDPVTFKETGNPKTGSRISRTVSLGKLEKDQ